ncbi:MAG: hypothetical protein R3345_11725, partial [Fulvivirga sp.]|nr:hypothetical protein [Fulvivirga sp.]
MTLIAAGTLISIYYDLKRDRIRDLNYSIFVMKRYYELGFEQWGNALLTIGQRIEEIEGEHKDSLRLAYTREAEANYDELFAVGYVDPQGNVLTFTRLRHRGTLPNLLENENTR